MQDYYEVLGVSPTADRAAIAAAYRRKSLLHHPDRGGSHEQMIHLNEAWEILGDPASRARYDAASLSPHHPDLDELARDDAQNANERAQNYPRQWGEFERWLNGVLADFEKTEFQEGKGHSIFGLIPESNTLSGNAFIVIGGIVGCVLLFYPALELVRGIFGPRARLPLIAAVVVPFALGGWIGALIHKAVGGALGPAQSEPPAAPPPPAEPRVVACMSCSQKLRVPVMDSELLVKCKTCGNQFVLPPG